MRSSLAAHGTEGWQRALATWLLRWHLCSLDAPTVAVVWAVTLARIANVPLSLSEGLVLALGTWIVYVLDRLLDGAADAPVLGEDGRARGRLAGRLPDRLKDRHYFHARHRSLLLRLCCASGALLALLCGWLPPRLVGIYLALGLPVAAYGLWVHGRPGWQSKHSGGAHPLKQGNGMAKEAAVAILFTAAVAAPALADASPTNRAALWIPSLLLAGLCWLNCTLISHAEASVCNQECSRPLQRLRLKLVAVALLLAAAVICGLDPGWHREASLAAQPAAAAVLLSCMALLGLLMSMGVEDQTLIEARRLRVLADLALLTPLLFLLPRWA